MNTMREKTETQLFRERDADVISVLTLKTYYIVCAIFFSLNFVFFLIIRLIVELYYKIVCFEIVFEYAHAFPQSFWFLVKFSCFKFSISARTLATLPADKSFS